MSIGVLIRAAAKRAAETAAYGVGAVNVTRMIPIESESMTNGLLFDEDVALRGLAASEEPVIVGYDVKGSITTSLWYEGLEYLLLAAMGFEAPGVYTGVYATPGSGGSPAPELAAANHAYHHIFEMDDTLAREAWVGNGVERPNSSGGATDPTYWTAADKKVRAFDLLIDKRVPSGYTFRFNSCMVTGFTAKATLQGVKITWDLLAKTVTLDNSSTAGWLTPAGQIATYGSNERAIFPHLAFGIGAAGASAPSALGIMDFELKVSNPLDASRESGSASQYIIEPVRSGVRKTTGTLKLARFLSTQMQTWMSGATDLQINAVFTGTNRIDMQLSSTWYRIFQLMLPQVRILKAEYPVAGPGVITGDIEFEATPPAAEPTWVTTARGGITKVKSGELIVGLRNSRGWCFSRDRQASGLGVLGDDE